MYNMVMNWLFRLLILAAFANALAWITIVPVWQYPDEQSHFAQIQYIAERGGIPATNTSLDTSYEVDLAEKILQTERDREGNNKFTYHPEYKIPYSNGQTGIFEKAITDLPKSARHDMIKREATLNPPLYYNMASLVYKMFSFGNLFTRVYAIRIFSSLIFMCTILTAFTIGGLIFKKNKILQVSLASITAFMPMLVFASTGILPDTLTNLLFSLVVLLCLEIIFKGISFKKLVLVILVIMFGAATRQNFLVSLLLLPVVVIHQLIFNAKSRLKIIIWSIMGTITLFIASYFVPALDFIHRFDFPESSRVVVDGNPLAHLSYIDHLKWSLHHSIAETWPWFWGIYKWLSLSLPHIVYQIIDRLVPFAMLGLAIKIIQIIRKKNLRQDFWLFFLMWVSFIYFMALISFDYIYRKNNGYSFGIQGRYFFPAIIPTLTIILVGYWQLFKIFLRKYALWGAFVLVVLFMLFNFVSQATVAQSYYSTSNYQTFINQMSQYKPLLFKGNSITIIFLLSSVLQILFLYKLAREIIILRKHEGD